MMVMVGQIRELETEIAQALRAHPDGEIFQSIFLTPDAVICAATLLSEIDDSRPRCSHRDATQERAVPVGVQQTIAQRAWCPGAEQRPLSRERSLAR